MIEHATSLARISSTFTYLLHRYSATRKMELEERRPSAENLPSQAKNARSEVIEEEQQARTYLSGWRLHVLTAG